MRPKAGHGWTWFTRNGRHIKLIYNCHGQLVTTGEAKDWPRCERCRRPEHIMPEGSRLCTTCYYYKSLPTGEFWNRKEDYLFPYNIGRRVTDNITAWDRDPLENPKVNWRAHLKSQPPKFH